MTDLEDSEYKFIRNSANDTLVIAGTYDGGIIGLNLKFDQEKIFDPIFAFKAHSSTVKDIDSNNNMLITASADETMKIYNLKTRRDIGILSKHEGTVTSICISNNCKYLISCGEDKSVCFWKCTNWEPLLTFNDIHEFTPVSSDFHPSMRLALTIDINCNICLINLIEGKLATKFTLPLIDKKDINNNINKKYGLFISIKFNNSGDYYAVLSQKDIIVSSIINTDWSIHLSNEKFKSRNIQLTCFDWITNESLILGFSNGDIKLFSINEKSLLPIELEFKAKQEIFDSNLNPHKKNRIKAIRVFDCFNKDSLSKISNKLVTCDSSGTFVIYNLYFFQKKSQEKCILEILDIYNAETRITCMTIQSYVLSQHVNSHHKKPEINVIKNKIKKKCDQSKKQK